MIEKDKIRIIQELDLNATMAFTPSEFGEPQPQRCNYPKIKTFIQTDKSGQCVDEFLRKKQERIESYKQRFKGKKPLFDKPPEIDKEA